MGLSLHTLPSSSIIFSCDVILVAVGFAPIYWAYAFSAYFCASSLLAASFNACWSSLLLTSGMIENDSSILLVLVDNPDAIEKQICILGSVTWRPRFFGPFLCWPPAYYSTSSCLDRIGLTSNSMREAKCILELTTEISGLIKLEDLLVLHCFYFQWSHLFQRFTIWASYSLLNTSSAEEGFLDRNLLFRRKSIKVNVGRMFRIKRKSHFINKTLKYHCNYRLIKTNRTKNAINFSQKWFMLLLTRVSDRKFLTVAIANKSKRVSKSVWKGSVAEWSKALALGASPKGRGFEPHHYHLFLLPLYTPSSSNNVIYKHYIIQLLINLNIHTLLFFFHYLRVLTLREI